MVIIDRYVIYEELIDQKVTKDEKTGEITVFSLYRDHEGIAPRAFLVKTTLGVMFKDKKWIPVEHDSQTNYLKDALEMLNEKEPGKEFAKYCNMPYQVPFTMVIDYYPLLNVMYFKGVLGCIDKIDYYEEYERMDGDIYYIPYSMLL